jgi:hypothetical protein
MKAKKVENTICKKCKVQTIFKYSDIHCRKCYNKIMNKPLKNFKDKHMKLKYQKNRLKINVSICENLLEKIKKDHKEVEIQKTRLLMLNKEITKIIEEMEDL